MNRIFLRTIGNLRLKRVCGVEFYDKGTDLEQMMIQIPLGKVVRRQDLPSEEKAHGGYKLWFGEMMMESPLIEAIDRYGDLWFDDEETAEKAFLAIWRAMELCDKAVWSRKAVMSVEFSAEVTASRTMKEKNHV